MKKYDVKVFSITVDGRVYFGVAPSIHEVTEWVSSLSNHDYARLFFSYNRSFIVNERYDIEYTPHSSGGFVELRLNGCEVPCKFYKGW